MKTENSTCNAPHMVAAAAAIVVVVDVVIVAAAAAAAAVTVVAISGVKVMAAAFSPHECTMSK